MAHMTILRLPRTDKPSDPHILLHLTQQSNRLLDLKLIATEHEHLYHGTITEAKVKSLQSNTYSGDLDEWKAVLKRLLLRQPHHEGASAEAFQGIEMVAAIHGTTLTMMLRKNIDGITQRLGAIPLERDDDREEVSFPEWTDTAVTASDELRAQLEMLQIPISSHQQHVAKLNAQLDDLIQAKKDHEEELLKKCAALLNAKKLKIRDQQRLLATSRIDPGAADAVSEVRSVTGRPRRAAGASQRRKRKDNGAAQDDHVDDDDEDNEMVDADADADALDENDDEDLDRQQETPPVSDGDATEDEDDEGEGFDDAAAPLQASKRGVGNKGRTVETTKASDADHMEMEDPGEPPPRRELPFQRQNISRADHTKELEPRPTPGEGDDDETDDEL